MNCSGAIHRVDDRSCDFSFGNDLFCPRITRIFTNWMIFENMVGVGCPVFYNHAIPMGFIMILTFMIVGSNVDLLAFVSPRDFVWFSNCGFYKCSIPYGMRDSF